MEITYRCGKPESDYGVVQSVSNKLNQKKTHDGLSLIQQLEASRTPRPKYRPLAGNSAVNEILDLYGFSHVDDCWSRNDCSGSICVDNRGVMIDINTEKVSCNYVAILDSESDTSKFEEVLSDCFGVVARYRNDKEYTVIKGLG